MTDFITYLTALFAGAIASVAASQTAAAGDLDAVEERGVLRVAISPLTPFVIKDEDGGYSGFEIDATKALASELGVEVAYVEKPFCELVSALLDDEADMIASGYSNTPERRRVLDFSLPYHDTEYFLVLEKNAAGKRKSLRAMNDKDLAIGYQVGGVSGQVAQGEFYEADLRGFSSFSAIMEALRSGAIDGAVMFSPYDDLISRNKKPEYTVPHQLALMRTIEAYALNQGDEALRDALNKWIMENELDGFWEALEAKWFDPETASVGARPAENCPALSATG